MATDLKAVPANTEVDQEVRMTQFCGPELGEERDRMRMQLTQGTHLFLTLSRTQAYDLALALLEWNNGTREEAE